MAKASVPDCPICGKTVPEDADARPFCSTRCKLVDLGRWLDGDYVVPGEWVVDGDLEGFDGSGFDPADDR